MQQIQTGEAGGIVVVQKGDLNFKQGGLQVLDIALEHEAALMEQGQLIAGVLQLPQRVGGKDGGGLPIRHVLADKPLDQMTHHRIETVEGFIQEQVVGPTGYGQNGGSLPPHAFGEML